MAVAQQAITFDVQDCKVYTIADVVGGTYGTSDGKDVPGIQEVSVEPNLITAELKGDGKVVAKKGKIDRLNFSCTYSELSLPVLAKILGGTVATAGSDTAESASLSIDGTSLPYFAVAFLLTDLQSQDSNDAVASVKMELHKCQITGGTLLSGSTDDFATPSFTAEAILTNDSNYGFGKVTFDETAATL